MYIKHVFLVLFAAYCAIFAISQIVLLSGSSATVNESLISISLSGFMCIMVFMYPLNKFDILAPPKLLSLLIFVFFPLFSFYYLANPELGKWYVNYFSASDLHYKVAFATCCTVAALPFFLGGYLIGWTSKKSAAYIVPSETRTTSAGRVLMLASIAVGILGMLAYANSIGGIRTVIEQMDSISNRKAWRETSSQAYYLGMLLMTGPTVLALQAIYEKAAPRKIITYCGLMIFSAGLLMITQASREKAIIPLLLFMMTIFIGGNNRFTRKGKVLSNAAGILALSVLVITFSIQTFYRASSGDGQFGVINGLRDFNRIDVSIVMFWDYFSHSSRNGYLLGIPLFDYPNQFLVRLFDFDPIKNTSEVLNEFIFSTDPNAGNPGAPFVGEVYINFGIFGYIIFIFIGSYFGRAHALLIKSNYDMWHTIIYSASMYFFTFKLCIYTGLSESILMIALVFIPVFFWRKVIVVQIR